MTTNTNGNPGSNSKKRKRGREKGTRVSVQRPNAISAMADRLSLPDTVLTYQDVADILTTKIGIRVTRATVWRFLHEELEPERPAIRAALGLPVTVAVPVCGKCGQPPLTKHHRCPGAAPKPRKPTRSVRRKRLIHDECWRMCYYRFSKVKG